jgi:hypothetical protein
MNAAPWRVVRLLYLIVERSETISSFFVNYRHCSNIVERSETVVDIFVKIVDCRVELIIAVSTVVSLKFWSFFATMVNF